ncbi:hypothetical protein PIB30_039550 [Stylosanthes scabra]|uniref:Pre-mRNA processing factor 4 (PRP4)-like domain-containing protein n=1 Tax=Stylosanthes scabra TaxID=79078 RepID=A0ABU6TFC1_9FABA|nr:hypothetical protein [Stylosanthes scabra]
MEVDEENVPSNPASESSIGASSDVSVNAPPIQPIIPLSAAVPPMAPIPTVPPPSVVPPIAPIPAPPLVRPLAPLPPRPPPPIRPPVVQNGEVGSEDSDSDNDDAGGRVNQGSGEYEISEESRLVRERQEKAMQELMMKRRAAALAVPTNDMAVRARLRRLGEPITLFGEREMERRDRLRMIMAKLDADGQLEKLMKAHEDEETAATAVRDEDEEEMQYPFYTEGPKSLLDARIDIAKYSLVRAALRLQRAWRRKDDPDEDIDAEVDWALKQAANLTLDVSENGDDRPLSGCSFSRDGKSLATCSLTGAAKLWSMPNVVKSCTLKGHTERATDVAYSPVHNHLATASADRTAKYWNDQGSLLKTFEGHIDRLARIAFHPSGKYLGTASFDKTWRLWDVETGEELLLQEGHSRSVYGLAFHQDGSLAASCGLDALARVWDLRTGRSILALEGHVKPKKSMYTIPAHSNLISQVKFEPQEGYFLVTASYDMTAKVWSARDFKPVKTLSGHEAKVTSVDVLGDGSYIATVSHDRTIKLWSTNMSSEQTMDIDT